MVVVFWASQLEFSTAFTVFLFGALVASTAPGSIREFSSLSRPGAMVASAAPGSIRDSRPGALVASTAPGNIRECSSLSRPGALGTLDFLPFVVVLFEEAPR